MVELLELLEGSAKDSVACMVFGLEWRERGGLDSSKVMSEAMSGVMSGGLGSHGDVKVSAMEARVGCFETAVENPAPIPVSQQHHPTPL